MALSDIPANAARVAIRVKIELEVSPMSGMREKERDKYLTLLVVL